MDFLLETIAFKPDVEADLPKYFGEKWLLNIEDYYKKAKLNMSSGSQGLLFETMEMLSDQISNLVITSMPKSPLS